MTGPDESTASRLDRIDALYWSDKTLALDAARAWLKELGPGDHGATSRRLELVCASIGALRGDAGPSTAKVHSVLEWAVEHDNRSLQSRCHRLLSVVFDSVVGDSGMAIEHALAANDLLDDSESPLTRAAARLCLADAVGEAGSYEEAQRLYGEALQIVVDDGAIDFSCTVLNNAAFTHFQAQDTVAALEAVDRLLRALAINGRPLAMHARDTIGRIYLSAGLVTAAEEVLSPAMNPSDDEGTPDSIAMCLVALSEVYRAQGKFDGAQAVIDRCQALCREHDLARWTAEATREQAETFAAKGSYREAFEAYQDFHLRSEVLGAGKREARGRVLEAAFQTAEARRESARYRELAERDPLTGLHNRRFVDKQLSQLLVAVRDGGTPLTIAMIDLDRFKRINDLRSHEVGDEVLRTVGRLLSHVAATVPDGVAARMGGEEFLLILPGVDEVEADTYAEEARRSIEEHDWEPITIGVEVTASIGVVVAPTDGQRSSSLLATADARLYSAKRGGRNRVVRSDSVTEGG